MSILSEQYETETSLATHDAIEDCLRLHRVTGIGPKTFQKLRGYFGSVSQIIDAAKQASHDELRQAGVSNRAINHLRKLDDISIREDLTWLEASDQHHILSIDDPRYPHLLKETATAPILLFVNGNINILYDPQIAIVGSRSPTQSGRDLAYDFAKHLATSGLCITSGLALGVDGFSHKGALDAGAPTIAVTATGLDRVYPARHRKLAHQIVEQGALVSEFPIGTEVRSQYFPQRNRIISGLSVGVLVVEAAIKSGSLITAKQASEQGREVFAIPGSIHNPLARGCHHLIRQGAKLVETAEHILEEIKKSLELHLQPSDSSLSTPSNSNTQQQSELDADYQKVLDSMGYSPVSIDYLVTQTGLTAEELSSILLMLELQGFVTSSGGGHYTRLAKKG